MNPQTRLLLLATLMAAKPASAEIVYQDDFTGPSISPVWNTIAGSPVTLDDANNQLDYVHAAGTSRRFLAYNSSLTGTTGYMKATISNFTGADSVWVGFVSNNPSNNANYATTLVAGNGTYEIFYNNTGSSQNFDNGAGWTGSLATGTGIWTTDGGATSAAATIGGSMVNIFGFGFANFGNAAVFPSSAFSVDSVTVADSLSVGTPSNTAPTVTVTAPADGALLNLGVSSNFTGTAEDTEDGDLAANLSWSSSIDGNIGTGGNFSTSVLSLGMHTITASVTDSGSLTGEDSITLTVVDPSNTEPIVEVTAPADGTTVLSGTSLTFTGSANDAQDGDLSANLSWTSSLNGDIGSGPSFSTSALSIGTHAITASAQDSGLLVGTDSISLTIEPDPNARRPNIIVIISDDAGYADFGFMDGPDLSGTTSEVPTPHLDSLANRGITFSRAYVAANCQPTRAAMVTGAYQARIGNENVGNNHFRDDQLFEGIPVEVDTIWDKMKALGYTTGAIGKWHLGSIEDQPDRLGNRPQNQGIDEFYGFWHGSRDFRSGFYNQSNDPDHQNQLRYIREALIHPDGSKTDTVVEYTDFPANTYLTNIFGDYAEQFVEDHHDDEEPFFLYVAHPAPHKPWSDQSPDYNDPRITDLTPNNRRQVASMMITMDKEIGDLMDKLDDPNGDGDNNDSITNDTLVVFINDNGGVAGFESLPDGTRVNGTDNGQLNGVKGSPHDGGICVPMIMAGAGIDPSRINTIFSDPVHGIDILPTSVALAGGALDPDTDQIDGVNLMPFINATNASTPHEVLVHRWRGTFSVIKDNWKLVNTHNTGAGPDRYRLYDLDNDRGEANNILGGSTTPEQDALVAELKRDLTDHEATWDKPRYPILARDLETEPLNIVNHFTFRPGIHNSWSAGVPDGVAVTTQPSNWYEGNTTNPENLFRSDGFTGAILEFPVSSSNYTSDNDLLRKTGMEFMLNRIILSGDFTTGSNRSATITGNDLIFTNDLSGAGPRIDVDATQGPSSGDFNFNVSLDMIMYHDLTFTGDGEAALTISGEISQYFESRGLTKTGNSTVALTGVRSYEGNTTVEGGTLTLGQANSHDSEASVRIADSGATLNLTFGGTDTVDKLFVGGIQQTAGVYGASGSGAENEIPQITGSGTLTVTSDPSIGYTGWSDANAPGQSAEEDHDLDLVENGIEYFMGESGSGFTALPGPDDSGTVTWTMGPDYAGVYGTDFEIESSSPGLDNFLPVPVGEVVIVPGVSISYTMPSTEESLFIRLRVSAE